MRPFLFAAATLVAAALTAGCAGQTGNANPSPVATSTVNLPPSYRFEPPEIVVGTGTTVTWTNNDHFSHNVQFSSTGVTDEPLFMNPGEQVQLTFQEPGTYDYVCSLHPQNMRGRVTVSP